MFYAVAILIAALVAETSAVCQDITDLPTGVTLDADVCSSGAFTDHLGSVVNGNILAAAAVTLGAPSITRGTVTAGVAFNSGAGSTVYGNIYDGAAYTSGASSVVYGCVYSAGAFTSGASSVINGCVYAGGTVSFGANSIITGTAISATNTYVYGAGYSVGSAPCSCSCTSPFHTTNPTGTSEIVSAAQYSNTSSTSTCVIDSTAWPLLAPSTNVYDIVADVGSLGGVFYNVEGVTFNATSSLSFQLNFVEKQPLTGDSGNLFVEWTVYDITNEGTLCGDVNKGEGAGVMTTTSPAVCNALCPYTALCNVLTVQINIPPASITSASRIVFTVTDNGYTSPLRNHFGLFGFTVQNQTTSQYVSIPLVNSNNLTTPCSVALAADVFNTQMCITLSNSVSHMSRSHLSNSKSHRSKTHSKSHSHSHSKSHKSHSHSHSKSHKSESHNSESRSHSKSHKSESHSDSKSHQSNSDSHQSQSLSPPPTVSFTPSVSRSPSIPKASFYNPVFGPYHPNANCSSPLSVLRFNFSDTMPVSFAEQYMANVGNYFVSYYDQYAASPAGYGNCKLDRIWDVQNVTGVISPLYFDVYNTGNGGHEVMGITTTAQNLSFIIEYAGPIYNMQPGCVVGHHIRNSSLCPEWIKVFSNYLETGALNGPIVFEIDAEGSISDTCDEVTPGNPDIFGSSFFGYNYLTCGLHGINITTNASHTCDAGCTSVNPDNGEISYECAIMFINCTMPFFDPIKNPSNHTFAIFSLFNNDSIPVQPLEFVDVSIVGFMVYNGSHYKKADIVNPANNHTNCTTPFALDITNLTLPFCCTDNYLQELYPYHDNSVVINRGPSEPNCPYLREVTSTNPVFAPFVGVSFPIPNGWFLDNIAIDLFAYFTPAHVNQYITFLAQDPGYYLDIAFPLPHLENPTLFYSRKCDDQMPVCQIDFNTDEYTDCVAGIKDHFNATINMTTSCPSLQQKYLTPGTYTILNGSTDVHATYGKAAVFLGTVERSPTAFPYHRIDPWLSDDVIFNIAWTDFFPGDAIYINSVTYSICEQSSPTTCQDDIVLQSTTCNALPIGPAPCTCPNCNDTSTTDQADPSFRYVTSELLVDNGNGPVRPPVSGNGVHVPGTFVDTNLNTFVRQSQLMFPYTPQPGYTAYNITNDNNCAVYFDVDPCSTNMQVWLSPEKGVNYQTQLATPRVNITSFSCFVLVDIFSQPPFPLTDNVFVAPTSEWTYIPTTFPIQKLVRIDILSSSTNTSGPLYFNQDLYGFEIPVQADAPLGGLYFYCDINIVVRNNTMSQTYAPLFSDKNFCSASSPYVVNTTRSGPYTNISVTNMTNLFNPLTGLHAQSHFHFLASAQCPSYELCPKDGWFFNEDYEIDTDYIGLKLQFPSADIHPDNVTGVIPYSVDITFKFNQPEAIALFDAYDPLDGDQLLLSVIFEGPLEEFNFLDFNIYLADGSCANNRFTQCAIFQNNTNGGNPGDWSNPLFFRRVLGQGVRLTEPTADLSVLDPYLFNLPLMGNCLTAITDAGFRIQDAALVLTFTVDNATLFGTPQPLYGADYDNAFALEADGLARRFYFYMGSLVLVTLDDYFANNRYNAPFIPQKGNYVVYRPSADCARRPYTPLDYCDGPCSQLFERDLLTLADNITAKAEDHPNSTVYDDIDMNSTAINNFLLGINFSIDPSLLGSQYLIPSYDVYDGYTYTYDYFDDETKEITRSICDYHTTLIAHDIAVNGTGYAGKIFVDEGTLAYVNAPPGTTHMAIFVSFKTELLVDMLNNMGKSIAEPFFPGIFVDYDNVTQQVHIFGTAVGITVWMGPDETAISQPLTGPTAPTFNLTNPQLILMFFDVIIPDVTRDFLNNDADFVSHSSLFLPGPYFSSGPWPYAYNDYPGPDQPFTSKMYRVCQLRGNIINPLLNDPSRPDADGFQYEYLYFYSRNLVDEFEVVLPYQDLVGADHGITFRMGTGIDEEGILGALPIVASVYSVGYVATAYMDANSFIPVMPGGLQGSQRFRFAMYPCFTNCPGNATHRMVNHPGFAAHEYIPNSADYGAMGVDNDTVIFNFTQVDKITPGLVSSNGNLIGGLAYGFPTGVIVDDRKRRVSPTHVVIVLNVDKQAILTMFDQLETYVNIEADIYTPLGITERDLGVYMDLRPTLGALNLFGIAAGWVYGLSTIRDVYEPIAPVVVALGDLPLNPNINIFPIYRYPGDNDLYLGDANCSTEDYAEYGLENCLLTGQLNAYFIPTPFYNSTTLPIADLLILTPSKIAFMSTQGDFMNVGDLVNGTGYDGVDEHIVSAWGQFTPLNAPSEDRRRRVNPDAGHGNGFYGGFKFVCEDCWNVFNDSAYFDWSNSCNQFALCDIKRLYERPLIGINCTSNGHLNLTEYELTRQDVSFEWIDQDLTAGVTVLISVTIVIEGHHSCKVNGTIAGVSFGSRNLIFNHSLTITVAGPFDGDNLPINIMFDQLGCGPIITHVQLNYSEPVDCNPQTESQSQSISHQTPVPSPSFSPTRDFCCVRDFPMTTYPPPVYQVTQSQPQTQPEGYLLNDRRKRSDIRVDIEGGKAHAGSRRRQHHVIDDVKRMEEERRLKEVERRRVVTPSPSPSPSESPTESTSPTYGEEIIYVCDPQDSPKSIMPGVTYQVRDEFVPRDSSYGPIYQRMGLRIGALWLTFVDPGASVHLEYTPGQGMVTLYGYGYGRWSLPPNRVDLNGFDSYFDDSLYYFELNYTVGLVHTGGLVREPFGPGGVPFVAQEQPTPSSYATRQNKGYLKDINHPGFASYIYAVDIPDGIYVPTLDPVTDSFAPVEFMILSGLGTGLGYQGWFGIGGVVADNCVTDTSKPPADYDIPQTPQAQFQLMLCHYNIGGPSSAVNDVPDMSNLFMFVIESACDNGCAPSPTPGVFCPEHNMTHTHSQSPSHSVSDTATEAGHHPTHRPHHHGGDDDPFPLWAVIVICVGGPLLVFIVLFIILFARRRRNNPAPQPEEGPRAPLLPAGGGATTGAKLNTAGNGPRTTPTKTQPQTSTNIVAAKGGYHQVHDTGDLYYNRAPRRDGHHKE